MNEQQINEKVNIITSKYKDLLDLDVVNKCIDITNNKDVGKVSMQTIKNISKWALNGSSNTEIAQNLELTEKQFKTLCSLCPTLVYVMQESREMAEIVLAGALYQRALGGQIVRKKVPVKVGDYEDGRKIGEHIEYAYQEEELPPDSNLLKFLAEKKLNEKFGEKTTDEDKEVVNVVNTLDPQQLAQLEKTLKESQK